eukprot:1821565-Pleurochrysis_carterae.AAC.1
MEAGTVRDCHTAPWRARLGTTRWAACAAGVAADLAELLRGVRPPPGAHRAILRLGLAGAGPPE